MNAKKFNHYFTEIRSTFIQSLLQNADHRTFCQCTNFSMDPKFRSKVQGSLFRSALYEHCKEKCLPQLMK